MTPETLIKREIKTYLKSLGERCYFVAYHTIGYGQRGVPDILVCYRGRFVGLEVKRLGGTATPWQRRAISEIIVAGGKAEVVHGISDVREILETIDFEITNQSNDERFRRAL